VLVIIILSFVFSKNTYIQLVGKAMQVWYKQYIRCMCV